MATPGRKPEFENLPQLDSKEVMIIMAQSGMINDEIASVFGMSINQFNLVLEKNPDLREALEEAKESPNFMVERALFKRALGYSYREISQEEGRPVKVVIKEVAPDPVSCIFWLKNRSPKKWRDVMEYKFSLRDRMERAHDAITSPARPKALGDGSKGDGG